MVWSALSLLTGLLLVQQLPFLPPTIMVLIGGAFFIGIMAWLRCWPGLFFAFGLLYGLAFAQYRLHQQLPATSEGIDLHVKGIIADLPEHDDKQTTFNFSVSESDNRVPRQLRLSWYYPPQAVKAGQTWAFTVKLKRPHGSLNPGGFDYERWLFSHSIDATGFVRPHPDAQLLAEGGLTAPIATVRQTIADKLSAALSGNANLGLIKALAIGDGSTIRQSQWEVFRKTGTIHLVVVSGSHIGLIAGLVYLLVRKLWASTGLLSWSPQTVAAIAAIVAGILYAGLAGFTLPTQRGVLMLTVAMLAIILQRHLHASTLLAIALLVILLAEPLAVLDIGFWLSFLSVLLIVYTLAGCLGQTGYWRTLLKLNWVTSLGLAPLLLVFFQQVSLVSPLANAFAVPIMSVLLVPLALLATLLLFIAPAVAMPLFILLDKGLQGLYGVLAELAEWPCAVLNHPQPPLWTLFFALPGIVWLLAPRGIPARWLGLVMLLPSAFAKLDKPAEHEFTVTVLDVGQGLAVAVQTANHWLVYDTGGKFSEDMDSGRNVVLPFLRSHGVGQLDRLVISHGDNDHIGGAASILKELPVATVLTSVPEQLTAFKAERCLSGQAWQWDGVSFALLSPPDTQTFTLENDNSCVLKISSANGSVLLVGDIQADAEQWLVDHVPDLKADVLVAPHHGSKTSSTARFLAAVQAKTILIPAGYRNKFGHPHADVLARYRDYDAHWLNTADSGALTAQIGKKAVIITGYRDTQGKYWNSLPVPRH